MRFNDINKKYTEIVNQYIARGYIINSATMAGSQGEISKIDLIKDDEVIRIWLNSESTYNWSDEDAWNGDMIVLRVSVWNKALEHRAYSDTVWMQDLTHIAEYKYYSLSKTGVSRSRRYYTESYDEALFSQKVRYSRLRSRASYDSTSSVKDVTSDKTREIAGKWLKRTKGYQRISWDRIEVFMYTNCRGYSIKYNGNHYRLA